MPRGCLPTQDFSAEYADRPFDVVVDCLPGESCVRNFAGGCAQRWARALAHTAAAAGLTPPLGRPLARAGHIERCARVLKPTGHLSHIANAGTDNAALERMQREHAAGLGPGASLTLVQPDGRQLAEVLRLMDEGRVRLEVARVFPLAEVAAAHAAVEGGHTRGKVVLAVP